MRLALVPTTALLLLLSPLPAAALDDLLGWQSTRWGMTDTQVKAAVHGDGFQTFPPPPRSYIKTNGTFVAGMNIGRSRCEVFFTYGAGRLNHVTVSCPATPDPYARLRDRLTQRYGSPSRQDTRRQEWKFPTTAVVLDGRSTHRTVTIDYSPAASHGGGKRRP